MICEFMEGFSEESRSSSDWSSETGEMKRSGVIPSSKGSREAWGLISMLSRFKIIRPMEYMFALVYRDLMFSLCTNDTGSFSSGALKEFPVRLSFLEEFMGDSDETYLR